MKYEFNSILQDKVKDIRQITSLADCLGDDELRQLREKYSHFDDKINKDGFLYSSSVVLDKLKTPRPYLHMMCSNHLGLRDQWASFWDQYGGGFSCVDSVTAGKMTSHNDTNYVPTCPGSQDLREFFINENGNIWQMFPTSCMEENEYDNFECSQEPDAFYISASRNGLTAKLEVCVHPERPMELWRISLDNTSDNKRELSWFVSSNIDINSYPAYYFDPRVVCEGILEDSKLVFINHDKNNKHPRVAFFCSDTEFAGYDMSKEIFRGSSCRSFIPSAVHNGGCYNSLGIQPYGGFVAALQFDEVLLPNEKKQRQLVLGKCPMDEDARKSFFREVEQELKSGWNQTRQAIDEIWDRKNSSFLVNTPDRSLDRYVNVWSKYQARNQARFTRALDKVGYRDVLQDIMGVCDFEAEYVKKRILTTLKYQFRDGRALRQYEIFEGGGHDTRMYMDSVVWIPDTLATYLKETGDVSLLNENVPFFNLETLQIEHNDTASVYEHACIAVNSLFENTGIHGLCKIGYGDWNDALSGLQGEQSVSVWLSCACVYSAKIMAEIAGLIGKQDQQKHFMNIADAMTKRINSNAWDGQWYVYAFDSTGKPVGSKDNIEGRFHLNVNTWALFSGVASAMGREKYLWEAIEQVKTPFGCQLLTPSYTAKSRGQVGRIADQVPGMFENGSIYTHGQAFYLYALLAYNKNDGFYKELVKTLSSNQIPDVSTCPPHQQSNFFVGSEHESFGKNLFSNFSGSLPWYRKCIYKMMGVEADYNGIVIEPRVPDCWDKYSVRKVFRGSNLEFKFRRTGKFSAVMNGKDIGNYMPADILEFGKDYTIEVTY